MTGKSNWSLKLSVFCLYCVLPQCHGQGTFRFTFEGQAPGTARIVQQYYERGMWFRPLGVIGAGNGFVRMGADPLLSGLPNNGTAYLQAALGHSLMFSFLGGGSFDLLSVDLAEYSTAFQAPLSVRFVGYRPDGSSITADLVTDGIIDGTGPLADFQTFYFGPEFTGLSRVELPFPGWSLDNLVVSVPEPNSGALLLVGAALLALRRWKR